MIFQVERACFCFACERLFPPWVDICVHSPDYLAATSCSDVQVSSRLSSAAHTFIMCMLGHKADGSVADNQTYDDWEADEEKYAYLKHELGESHS